MRVLQGVAHAGLGGEMHHDLEAIALEQRLHPGTIGEIELQEGETMVLLEQIEPCMLERRVVILVQIVDADDRLPCPQQILRQMEADEAGAARDE